jgi:hypothetical protein
MNNFRTNESVSTEAIILLAEYTEMFKEIRNIHDKRMLILKITLTIMVGLFGYLTTGIILYVKSKGAQAFSIPVSLAWCYSSIGLLITLASYFFVHNIYYYYSPSKKHPLYHLLFFFIFALFLSPFFAPIDPDAGVVIPSADLIIFKKALTLLWPLLLLRLATGVLICLLS